MESFKTTEYFMDPRELGKFVGRWEKRRSKSTRSPPPVPRYCKSHRTRVVPVKGRPPRGKPSRAALRVRGDVRPVAPLGLSRCGKEAVS